MKSLYYILRTVFLFDIFDHDHKEVHRRKPRNEA